MPWDARAHEGISRERHGTTLSICSHVERVCTEKQEENEFVDKLDTMYCRFNVCARFTTIARNFSVFIILVITELKG
jgi:hypothetical protein